MILKYILLAQLLIFISVALIIFSKIIKQKDIQEYYTRLRNPAVIVDDVGKKNKKDPFEGIRNKIGMAGYKFSPEIYIVLKVVSILLTFFIVQLLLKDIIFSLPSAIGGFFIPDILINQRISKRKDLLTEQLIEWLDYMSSMGTAGKALLTALEYSIEKSRDPLKPVLEKISANIKKSKSLSEAFEIVTKQISIPEFKMVSMAISVHSEITNEGWPRTFENISSQMKENRDLFNTIDASNTESRINSYIIGLMPLAMFIVIRLMQPDYVATSLESPIGKIAYIIAGLLSLSGMYLVRRISNVAKDYKGGI